MIQSILVLGTIITVALFYPTIVFAEDVSVSIADDTSVRGCEITRTCHDPYEVKINIGDAVTWTNNDSTFHTITTFTKYAESDLPFFDSGSISPGDTFSTTYRKIGTFEYFCTIHPWAKGLVTVSGGQTHPELFWESDSLRFLDSNGNPTYPKAGQKNVVIKQVANTGLGDAVDTEYRLEVKVGNSLLFDQKISAEIPALSQKSFSFEWMPDEYGKYDLVFTADMASKTGDPNRANNIEQDKIIIFSTTAPPYAQMKYGVQPSQVQCDDGLELLKRIGDGSGICITSMNVQKIIDRGFAQNF